jgi:hypothetical protein
MHDLSCIPNADVPQTKLLAAIQKESQSRFDARNDGKDGQGNFTASLGACVLRARASGCVAIVWGMVVSVSGCGVFQALVSGKSARSA